MRTRAGRRRGRGGGGGGVVAPVPVPRGAPPSGHRAGDGWAGRRAVRNGNPRGDYPAPAGNDLKPPVTLLLPIGTAASAQSPTGTVVVSVPVGPPMNGYADTYFLAVDDLGAPTDFTVEATLGVGDISFDPPSGLVPVTAAGPPQPGIVVYNAGPGNLFVELPAMNSFQVGEASSPDGRCWASGPLPSSGPVTVTVEGGGVCTLAFAVDPLATPAPGQSVEEDVTLTASGSATLSGTYTLRATGVGGGGGPAPANDLFSAAQDISGLTIPAYIAGQGGQPVNTVSAAGTTLGSTREPFEYGTCSTPTGPRRRRRTGRSGTASPRRRAAFPAGSASRTTPGFLVDPLVMSQGVAVPSPRADEAPVGAGRTSGRRRACGFVRMEPGHTVWLQVSAVLNDGTLPPTWIDGDFRSSCSRRRTSRTTSRLPTTSWGRSSPTAPAARGPTRSTGLATATRSTPLPISLTGRRTCGSPPRSTTTASGASQPGRRRQPRWSRARARSASASTARRARSAKPTRVRSCSCRRVPAACGAGTLATRGTSGSPS